MTDAQNLAGVRALHTAIYLLMASCTAAVFYGGATGSHGAWLWVATALLVVEGFVFAAAGMRCPLTAVAVACGSEQRGVPDTFLPERFTRHTLTIFGPLLLAGLTMLVARWWNLGWNG